MKFVSTLHPQPVIAALCLLLAASLVLGLRTSQWQDNSMTLRAPQLSSLIPMQLSGWRAIGRPTSAIPVISRKEIPIYGEVLNRIYQDPQGRTIMLSVAWGEDQLHDSLQAHRPEYCYQAFGFDVRHITDDPPGRATGWLPVRRLLATRTDRSEPVSYWMTLGDTAVLPGIQREWAQFRHSVLGQPADGLLIRISSLNADTAAAFPRHDQFIRALLDGIADRPRFGVASPDRLSTIPKPDSGDRT